MEWREKVAREKRASFSDEEYWGRPVPSFGDPEAQLLVVGLAPAAHGANRTGRMFTGDRSGKWLFRALHQAGFANQFSYERADDGLELRDLWLTAVVHCAPPDNKPTPEERDNCQPYLEREMEILRPSLRAVVALGGYAWNQVLRVAGEQGFRIPTPRPSFGHGQETVAPHPDRPGRGEVTFMASYHPSQQNTFTGRLTREMFDRIWERAREVLDSPSPEE